MDKRIPTREEAYELLTKYNKSESLIHHALAVEATMLHFAKNFRGRGCGKMGNYRISA